MKKKIGLLVMAYGTPYSLDDIKRYYTHIRSGREPSEKLVEQLREKYEAIGGISPLAGITKKQANLLEQNLNSMQNEYEFQLFIGLRHIDPYIEDAIAGMAKSGIKEAVSIILAPHYSSYSINGYNNRAKKEAEKYNINLKSVQYWYTEQQFIQFWAQSINEICDSLTVAELENTITVYTAHSLPQSLVKDDDPYVDQMSHTAKLVSEKTKVSNYKVGWQSAGKSKEQWLDPDVFELTSYLYNEKGYRSFIYAPVGFVSDHLEILYDNDYECKELCDKLGATYYRAKMPNDNPLLIAAMSSAILKKLR